MTEEATAAQFFLMLFRDIPIQFFASQYQFWYLNFVKLADTEY